MKQSFLQKNQVLISGLAGTVALVLQQFLDQDQQGGQINYAAIGLAVLSAVGGYLGNALRGRGVSMAGILGVVGYAFYQVQTTGHFNLGQLILLSVLGFLSIVAPPPKPATYEKNANIVAAKEIPPVEQVVDDTHLPNPINPEKTDLKKP